MEGDGILVLHKDLEVDSPRYLQIMGQVRELVEETQLRTLQCGPLIPATSAATTAKEHPSGDEHQLSLLLQLPLRQLLLI